MLQFLRAIVVLGVSVLLGAVAAEAQTLVTKYVDRDCTFNGTGDSSTCAASNGAAGAYNSFCNAESDITTDYPNLVTSDVIIDVLMAGTTADTCGPDINGQTTDATRYMRFRCDPNKGDGCNNTGVWSNSHYRLVTGNTEATLKVQDDFVRVENIQVENNGLADASNRRAGIEINNTGATTDIRILGNIVRFTGTGSNTLNSGIYSRGSADGTIANNITYGWTGHGITVQPKANGTIAVYNNTSVANTNCFGINTGASNDTLRLYNNICNSSTTADYGSFSGLTTLVSGNNVSEDATSPDVSFRSRTVSFVDEAGRNLLLASGDTNAKNAGTSLSADSWFAFSTDIRGTSRPQGSFWDIGAHEDDSAAPAVSSLTINPALRNARLLWRK